MAIKINYQFKRILPGPEIDCNPLFPPNNSKKNIGNIVAQTAQSLQFNVSICNWKFNSLNSFFEDVCVCVQYKMFN